MNDKRIREWVQKGMLRRRSRDIPRIRSLLSSAEVKAEGVKLIPIEEKTATVIFGAIYESLRQLGDAKWWSLGYEPSSHDPSMQILADSDVENKIKLHSLDRFRRIRNDANYRGYQVTIDQAKEILEFWDEFGGKLSKLIKKQ